MLQAEFLTFKKFFMGEISNMNEKISAIFSNSGKQKESKELEHLETGNENKTLIIKSLLGNVFQLVSYYFYFKNNISFYKKSTYFIVSCTH